jgi:large subunit ribosomal protein L18
MDKKIARRDRRKKSIRKKISGTAERPRMAVHKTNKNLYVQVIDDVQGKTICGVSTSAKADKSKAGAYTRKNVNFAAALGEKVAKEAMGKGVKKVVMDRAGYKYHGVVKAIAEAARKTGLEF